VRIGPLDYKPLLEFEFEGFSDYIKGMDSRITDDMPRQWQRF